MNSRRARGLSIVYIPAGRVIVVMVIVVIDGDSGDGDSSEYGDGE